MWKAGNTGMTLVDFGPLAHVYLSKTGSGGFVDTLNFVSGHSEQSQKTLTWVKGSKILPRTKISIVFGITHTSDASGGSDNKMFLRIKEGSNDWVSVDEVLGPTRPKFQPSRIFDIYLGQRENMGNSPDENVTPNGNLPLRGNIYRFAIYEEKIITDQGPELSRLYYDFTDKTKLDPEDQGRERLPATFQTYVAAEGGCTFARGAIRDSTFIAIAGGYKLHEGGVDGLTLNMTKKFASDATAYVVGDYVFVASNGRMHVINSRRNYVRGVGIPDPGIPVRQESTGGSGVLDGIYAYGYRFVTSEGTYGPLKRLNPIRALDSTTVNLGVGDIASVGIDWMKNGFGAYRGVVPASSKFATPEAGYFRYDASSLTGLPNGTYPVHVALSAHDATSDGLEPGSNFNPLDEQFEHICHRGLKTSNTNYWRVANPPSANWRCSVAGTNDFGCQIAFRLGSNLSTRTKDAVCLFSVGQGGHRFNSRYDNELNNALDILLVTDTSTAEVNESKQKFRPVTDGYGTYASATEGIRFIMAAGNTSGGGSEDPARQPSAYFWGLNGSATDGLDNDGLTSPAGAFWINDHDYIVNVGRSPAGEFDVWLIDVTAAAAVGVTDNYDPDDVAYSRRRTANWRSLQGGHSKTWRIGRPKTTNSSVATHLQRIKANGSSSMQYHHEALFKDGGSIYIRRFLSDMIFYHARIWDKKPDITLLSSYGWRVNLPEGTSGLRNGLQLDIGGINERGESHNRMRNMALPPFDENWHSDLSSAVLAEALSPPGLGTKKSVLFSLGSSTASAITDLPVVVGISELNDGMFFIGDPSNPGKQVSFSTRFWDTDSLASGLFLRQQLKEATGLSNLVNMFWVGFDLNVAGASDSARTFRVTNVRVGSRPWGDYDSANTLPGSSNGAVPWYNQIPLGSTATTDVADGFLWLGGHPLLTGGNDYLTQFYEVRVWEKGYSSSIETEMRAGNYYDYWNTQLPNGTGIVSPLGYAHCLWYSMFRQYDRVTPAGVSYPAPEYTHSQGICDDGRKFQSWGSLGPTEDNSNDSDYANDDAAEVFRGHDVATADEPKSAICRLTNFGSNSGNEDGDNDDIPNDFAFGQLPFPALDVPGIAAIELFRSDGIPLDSEQRSDAQFVQNMYRSASGQPLRKVARLAFGTRGYRDNVPNATLGEEHIPGTGFVPPQIDGISGWQGQLVTWGDGNTLKFAESGPYGWESYPSWLFYEVHSAAGNIKAVTELDGQLFVFGKTWGVRLLGSVGSPEEDPLGQGVGAYSARCTAEHGDVLFAFNGKLWAIDTGGNSQEFGLPVQESLPTHENVRLVVNSKLASLFVIDETTGEVMRYHLPTQTWSVESRDATSLGETIDGDVVWTTRAGNCAKEDSTVYGDDVLAATPQLGVSGTSGGTVTITGLSTPWTDTAHVGMRVSIKKPDGLMLETRIATLVAGGSSDSLTVEDSIGESGAITLYYGAGATGALLDTGPYLLENERGLTKVDFDVLAGTGWEIGTRASHARGELGSRTDIDFVSATTANRPVGFGLKGRWQRIVLRNRVPEEGRLGFVEGELTDE